MREDHSSQELMNENFECYSLKTSRLCVHKSELWLNIDHFKSDENKRINSQKYQND